MGRLTRTAAELVDIDEQRALDVAKLREIIEMHFPVGDDKKYTAEAAEDYWFMEMLSYMRALGVNMTMFDNVEHIFLFEGRDEFNALIKKLFNEWIVEPYDFFSKLTSVSVNTEHHWMLTTPDDKMFTHGDELDKLFEEAVEKAINEIVEAAQAGGDTFDACYNGLLFDIDDAIVQK